MADCGVTMRTPTITEWCDLLSRRTPIDEREHRSVQSFIAHATVLSDPFDESADPVHVTASAIVIDEVVGAERVVLHLHKRLGIWLQPGGHIDRGESPSVAALREAREETGLDVHHPDDGSLFIHLDVHPGPRGHTHLDLRFLVLARGDTPRPAEGESPEVRWFGFEEALAIADEGLRGGLLAARAVDPCAR